MNAHSFENLVLDALCFRDTNKADTCFPRNLAGEQLFKQSAAVLPHIENVLLEIVAPRFADADAPTFLGLSDLLGAYLVIGSRCDIARAVQFLRTMPPALQADTCAFVPVFFRNVKVEPQEREVNNLKVLPDEQLISFIKEASRSENHLLREKAKRAISFLLQEYCTF